MPGSHALLWKHTLRVFALALSALGIHAQQGSNLIRNPEFDGADANIFVWNQNPQVSEGKLIILPAQGPDGQTALRLDPSKVPALKQGGIRLVEGEKYRMGGWIRTNDLKSDFWLCSFVVYNHKWTKDVKAERFPVNTNGKWVRIEKEFNAPPSDDGTYAFALYVSSATGSIDVASPYLISLSDKAKKESQMASLWESELKRITPYYPVLSKVSCETGELRFCTAYPPNQRLSGFICRVTCAGKSPVETPFDDMGLAAVNLGALPEGDGAFTVEQLRKDDRSTVLANTYAFKAIRHVAAHGKRLNNLVVELLNTPLTEGGTPFTAPEDGWYRIAFTQLSPGVTASLDGIAAPVIVCQEGFPPETMRFLERGQHTLAVNATNAIPENSRLVIAHVPQLSYYPLFPAPDSYFAKADSEHVCVKGGAYRYDLDFCRRYIWPSFNTCIVQGAWNPESPQDKRHREAFDSQGIQVLGCNGFIKDTWKNGDAMTKAILASPHVKYNDGRCLDEIFCDMIPENFLALIEMGWNLQDFNKIIHTWAGVGVTGQFRNPALHRPAIAALNNVSRGRGKVLLETYAYTTPDKDSMEQEMDQIAQQLTALGALFPDAPSRVHCMMGGYIQPLRYCTDCYPQTDPKVFYDRFFQTIATRPEYKGLAGLGCYCLNFADEEHARWIAAITRHYAVEGNTALLSDKFGFVLNPNHLENPDFSSGLTAWTPSPAVTGSLIPLSVKGFGGRTAQNRIARKRSNLGDECVQFTVSAKAPNRLSQKLKGLIPGKLYSIRYATANPEDIASPTKNHHPIAIQAFLDNATVFPSLGYDATSLKESEQKQKASEVIIRKIVFRAEKESVTLTFSDWTSQNAPAAPEGTRRILNFVAVRPYFK